MTNLSGQLFKSGELQRRAEEAYELLQDCSLCPRNCGVNRLQGDLGVCGVGRYARVASYGPHFGEEQPLVGNNGSGTIFFAGCNLHCCFCQNYDISHHSDAAQEFDRDGLAGIILDLQSQGCHNINFVTPSHVVPQILAATVAAAKRGLNIPLVFNCSGYESVDTLAFLDGVIDIYMPDFKFWHTSSGQKYAEAPDYPEVACGALRAMHEQVGELRVNASGLAESGLMVRHLVMPEALEETEKILDFLSSALSPETYVNIMDQYRPCGTSDKHPELRRSITAKEYQRALEYALRAGLTRLDKRDLSAVLKNLGIL